MSTERIARWQDLTKFLDREQVPYKWDESDLSFQIPVHLEGFNSQLYLRWEPNLPYVQGVCPVHLGVPDDRVAAVESACARLNHAIALPGFGYDHERKFVYFRLTLTIEPGGMDGNFFGLMSRAVINNAYDFHAAISGVVLGESAEGVLAAALAKAKDKAAKTATANPGYNE